MKLSGTHLEKEETILRTQLNEILIGCGGEKIRITSSEKFKKILFFSTTKETVIVIVKQVK